jgi:hypothetical protein
MELPGVGPGAADADRFSVNRALPPPPPVSPPTKDSVAGLLGDLARADLTSLLDMVENAPSAAVEAQGLSLLQAAVSAVMSHDSVRALQQLHQLAILDPRRAEGLTSEPGLASIRPAVGQLLSQLTGAAKLNAEGRLAEATHRWDAAAFKPLPAHEPNPDAVLLVATRLVEAGGLSNYVRSAAISNALLDDARWVPAFHPEPVPAGNPTAASQFSLRWLIAAWFVLGLAGACICWWLEYDRLQAVFEVWSAGLLLLACFGAWQRMRR